MYVVPVAAIGEDHDVPAVTRAVPPFPIRISPPAEPTVTSPFLTTGQQTQAMSPPAFEILADAPVEPNLQEAGAS